MFDLGGMITPTALQDLGKVISIDLMLAGDNVVILGAVAARLPKEQRQRILRIGIGIALVFLIGFAFMATTLLKITGVLFVGGVLLLWVSWKLFRELTHRDHAPEDAFARAGDDPKPATSFNSMIWQVVVAELSMSLENVLAVAGAARKSPTWVLIVGLAFSVMVMAVAANLLAKLIERHRWLAFAGLAMILWVSFGMIWQGWGELHPHVMGAVG
jgi:YjbE family integral membrane protein